MRNFNSYSISEYRQWLNRQSVSRRVTHIQIHHTWKPRKTDYTGERTILGMYRYHTETRGWTDLAQHITIAPDGVIWDGRNLNLDPAGISGHNRGGIMIEMIGNFDAGEERLEGPQLQTVLAVVHLLMKRFALNQSHIVFHREHAGKTCPGTGINKTEFIRQVNQWREEDERSVDDVPIDPRRFSDVPNNHYAAEAIESLAKLGIIQGRADGTFGLKDPLTRADAALLLYRFLEYLQNER